MKLAKILNKYVFIVFLLFAVSAIIAFWPSYYSRLNEAMSTVIHLHGIGMSLWLLILIVQAVLARFKQFKIHKYVGWLSYLVLPFIVVSTLVLLHQLLNGVNRLSESTMSFMALVILSLFVFVTTYLLAIYHKKTSLVHARYMVATIFPLVTPISDRIVSRHYPSMMEYALHINGSPNIQSLGFMLVDLLIVLLILWDYKSHKKKYIFLTVLVINILFQFCVFNCYKYDAWKTYCEWFVS